MYAKTDSIAIIIKHLFPRNACWQALSDILVINQGEKLLPHFNTNCFMQGQNPFFIIEFQQGSPDAVNVVYRLYLQRLYNFSRRFIDNQQAAEDMVADTFVKLWQLRDGFINMQNIKAFLYISVRNKCVNYLKAYQLHSRLEKEAYGQVPVEEEMFHQEVTVELIEKLEREISKLPDKQQEVITMILYEGKTVNEVAERLNKPAKTVRNLRALAIVTLRLINENRQLGTA